MSAEEKDNKGKHLFFLGVLLILVSFLSLLATFFPVLKYELTYFFKRPFSDTVVVVNKESSDSEEGEKVFKIQPIDPNFSIVIPKLGINVRIVKNVNPYDPSIYQQALIEGIAHAEGTVFPGQIGNTFLFSHSSLNFMEARKYNSIFYLLYKLQSGDVFYISYLQSIYKYEVSEVLYVSADSVNYLKSDAIDKQATLMTCWPPGTTLKRLIVTGMLVDVY